MSMFQSTEPLVSERLSEEPPQKKKKTPVKQVGDLSSIHNLDMLEEGQKTYIQIPKALLEDSGLRPDRNIMIYTRQGVLDEWKFLRDDVIRDAKTGWILGPPGTGKSISAYWI
jgi:hypothetical protein